ncbi:MAG: MFS transporter [Rhodobacteraceae bacterium]|nr:MFS transporter [Paracoccaceae bacterium]
MITRGIWSPLANRTYRGLLFGSAVSNLGSMIQVVGAGWLMTQLTTSPVLVALVQSSNTLPMMVLALVAGVLADGFDRRRLMLGALLFMSLVSAVLAALAYAGALTPLLLLAFTFMLGAGMAIYSPAWQASLGDIVTKADLSPAVTLNTMAFNMMRSIGPAGGGLLVAVAGAATAFLLNAISYLPLTVATWAWRAPTTARRLPREPLVVALSAGLRYLAMSPALMRVMLRGALFGFGGSAVHALMPLVARDLLGGDARTFGLLLGAFGVGALAAAFVNAAVRARLGNERVVQAAFLTLATGLAINALSRSLALSMFAMALSGASWVLALSLFNVTVQLSTARWVVGRALSFYQTASFGGMALGAWVWGQAASSWGAATALAVAAVTLTLSGIVGRLVAMPEYGTVDLDPLGRFHEPELRLGLKPSSGPIMVMVDYRIAADDTDAFLALMRDRRRIRIRDGARQWALLRDLEHPETWTESYHVPTWADYIRHNERRTKADADVAVGLRALHRGDGPPRVHRMIERQTVPLHEDLPLKPPPELH